MDHSLVSRADVVRTKPPTGGTPHIPLYIANGRLGTCIGPWGLGANPDVARTFAIAVPTVVTSIDHNVRGGYNLDYLMPIMRTFWSREPDLADARDYTQHQSFLDGTIETRYRSAGYTVAVTTWFDPVRRGIHCITVDSEGAPPEIVLAPLGDPRTNYGMTMVPEVAAWIEDGVGRARVVCRNAKTEIAIRTNGTLRVEGDRIVVALAPVRTEIIVGVDENPDATTGESLARTRARWHDTWSRTGWVAPPDDEAQSIWTRSVAYILMTCGDEGRGLPPPMGLSGNGWAFAFPQDLSYIHPVLLAIGRLDVARSWIEYWAARIPGMRAVAKRLWKHAEGAYVPWEFPYGPVDDILIPEAPNVYQFEIHNPGYVVRMAHETAIMLDDPAWAREYADPLVREIALYYLSISHRESDGGWHIHVVPSMGQDEQGGVDQPNYLCALTSARYALQTAVARGLDADGRMRRVLDDGYAFDSLVSDRGFRWSCGGSGARDFGTQKHPVQLNPLAYLPIAGEPDTPTRRAWELRYEITDRALSDVFPRVDSLAEFLLASTRMGDAGAWRRDWGHTFSAGYVDPELVTIYESSGNPGGAFYTTTHGLYAQAIAEWLRRHRGGDGSISPRACRGRVRSGSAVSACSPV